VRPSRWLSRLGAGRTGRPDRSADKDFVGPALLLEVMRRGVLLVVVLALASASVVVSGAGALASRSSAPGDRRLTVYSVATGLQYINTADDRARGKVNNPLDSTANKLAPKSSGSRNGPFAGDVAVYALRLYSDAAVKHPVGSAVYTCFFNYDRHALCQAYYKFKAGGTIVGSGPVDFKVSSFTIDVSGGTGKYLGARGEASAVAARGNAQRIDFELTNASRALRASQKLTVYAVPATVQFMNHADDRLRGMSVNPFKLKAEAVIFGQGGKEKGNGPFPGDDILYGFKLFADANRSKPIGTAMFTCYYQFVKRATCDSYFDLAKGLLLASGQVRFGAPRFTLGVIGGTHAYLGALGQVNAAPTAGSAQRFDLRVTGLRK
jgi:hypothetical protein